MIPGVDTSTFRRAQAYRLLSACYYEPDERFASTVAAEAESVGPEFIDIAECVRPPASLAAIKQDYVRLFIGPFKALAPPYGSMYLEQEARLMGESTADVEAWYREDGLRNDLKQPPDHIITELEYLGFLAGMALSDVGGNAKKTKEDWIGRERRFLGTHVARWVPGFCRDVAKHGETSFYRRLAEVTGSFVESVSGDRRDSACSGQHASSARVTAPHAG